MHSDDRKYGTVLWIAIRDQCEVPPVSNETALITGDQYVTPLRIYSRTMDVGSALGFCAREKPEVVGVGYERNGET